MAYSLPGAEGVHPDLLRLIEAASGYLPPGRGVRVGEHGGRRDEATQRQLLDAGRSKTMNSRHLTGNAIDLIPLINGSAALEDDAAYGALADAMMRASQEMNLPVEWGGNWKSFVDKPHWQLGGEGTAPLLSEATPPAATSPRALQNAAPNPAALMPDISPTSNPMAVAFQTAPASVPPPPEATPDLRGQAYLPAESPPSAQGLSPLAKLFSRVRPFETTQTSVRPLRLRA